MTIKEFKEFSHNKLIYLDGATGSNLMKRGMPAGVCPEKWILEHPDVLVELQREYVEAGSNILYAPTFTANRIKLAEYGLEGEIARINHALVELSRRAALGKALVAGDITMTGRQLAPMGNMDFEELICVYKEQIRLIADAGADLLVVETMMSLQESRAALIAAREVCDLPVMVTLTFEPDGRTLYGTDALTAAVTLEKLGACAVGANCSTGPDRMQALITQIAEAVSIPVIAKPNAGMPALNEAGETVYDMDPDTFGAGMKNLAEAGARILGGCCGTSPEYIKKLVEATEGLSAEIFSAENLSVPKKGASPMRYLTSERKTLAFGLDSPFLVVGERINPTGKKKLQAELREGRLDLAASYAREQEECGASVLDINVGMSGIDEKETILKVLDEVMEQSNLPLSIDSSHVEVIEAALRRYPGRALINSISGESEKLERLLPIARKYGAMFILLPLSDKGLPESLQEKIEIIEKISQMAFDAGMTREDIVVDGLVTTVGANKRAAQEVLETIRYCRERGLATICGLSNISFGLPERSFVNTAFLTMAIREGLTMAIANPSQELLMNMAFASDLLMDKEGADIRYIERMEEYRRRNPAPPPAALAVGAAPGGEHKTGDLPGSGVPARPAGREQISDPASEEKAKGASFSEHILYRDVMKGNRRQILEHTKAAVEEGTDASLILNELLLPAINEVGELFDKGKYFLPQLIASAEAMKISIEYLEPLLAVGTKKTQMPVVVIATVAGDIHDIGKNLVALMLKNYGFQVIDLGKDVPGETIVEAAIGHQAAIIALSALMTTTMQEMKHVIALARERKVSARIMIGGAVITPEYAREIGADAYSRDAADAVRVAKSLLGLE